MGLGKLLMPSDVEWHLAFSKEKAKPHQEDGELMWRSNNQSSEQAVHSQGAFVVRDTLNFCKWGKWCIVMPWQSSWQNVGWVCLILLMPGCKHSVEEMEEKKEWWERRVDVRVHFLPFHSKVSVRTEGACLAAAPSSDRPNTDRAVWERARVSPYRDMLAFWFDQRG